METNMQLNNKEWRVKDIVFFPLRASGGKIIRLEMGIVTGISDDAVFAKITTGGHYGGEWSVPRFTCFESPEQLKEALYEGIEAEYNKLKESK